MMSDLELLRRLGTELTHRPQGAIAPASSAGSAGESGYPAGPTVEDLLIEGLLKVRSKNKGLVRLRPNRAQVEYSRRLYPEEHRAEGAAAGDDDIYCGAIFCPYHHATGNDRGASGAQPGISGGNF